MEFPLQVSSVLLAWTPLSAFLGDRVFKGGLNCPEKISNRVHAARAHR
jgi:hypothetical protein